MESPTSVSLPVISPIISGRDFHERKPERKTAMQDTLPTPEELDKLKDDVVALLRDYDMLTDVCIYVNGNRYNCTPREPEGYIVEPGLDPADYFEYVRSEGNLFAMSFEGTLNHVLNMYIGGYDTFLRSFDALFEDLGLYYEFGDAWNLSCYPDW